MKRFDFSDLQPGQFRSGLACLRTREDKQTKDGKPYLVLDLGNSTGAAPAKVWSEDLDAWEGIDAGAAVEVAAQIKDGWRGGSPELDITSVERLDDEHPVRLEINPQCPVPRETLQARFEDLSLRIKEGRAYQLLGFIMDHVGAESFYQAPAAIGHHHNYIGGLAEHSIEVGEIAVTLAETPAYRDLLDIDVIILGSLTHDIGKIDSYRWAGEPISMAPMGLLRSHVSRGPEIVTQALGGGWPIEAGLVSGADVEHLKHIMESHHGQLDWGSPVPPRTMEATIVHLADLSSARMAALAGDLTAANPDKDGWIDPPGWRRKPVWDFRTTREKEYQELTERALAEDNERGPWYEVEGVGGTDA